MKIAGITAEYNPFHTGHAYQIAQTRAALGEDCAVAAVMSGNWVQQADCAIADKWTRARLALQGGVDLVLELPTVWAVSSAEHFARGAVSLLAAAGADVVSFGSECGDVQVLQDVAACLDSEAYHETVRTLAGDGLPFAVCRQQAVEQRLGPDTGAVLAQPNNNLGVEYIRAMSALGGGMEPMTVLRKGSLHNSLGLGENGFVSATRLRTLLRNGARKQAQGYLPGGEWLPRPEELPDLARAERAILARLRTMTAQDWAQLPDSGAAEGLTQRLERAGRTCTGVSDFLEQVKTKRFTHARLRRLVLWAYLGLTAANMPDAPPYIRVLGFNQRGREALRQIKERAQLPIITKPAHARQLAPEGRKLFELEVRCTDLYDLCFACLPASGREWVTDPVVLL